GIRVIRRAGWLFTLWLAWSASSASIADEGNKVAIQKLFSGLKTPLAVAVRPSAGGEPQEVFVAESGAGRVVRFSDDKPKTTTPVITGFATTTVDQPFTKGVQSLLFLDRSRLVATGGDGERPFARLYELPEAAT